MVQGHGLVVDLIVLDYQLDLMISAVFYNLSDSMILYMLLCKHSAPHPKMFQPAQSTSSEQENCNKLESCGALPSQG